MSLKMLIFDFKEAEKDFFKHHHFDEYDITFFESTLDENSVNNLSKELLDETTVISVFITSRVTEDVLNKFKNLRIISTRSTGYDHIDIKNCCNRHIKVINVENYGIYSVVQYTFGLIIALIRKIIPASIDTKTFKFEYDKYIGRELNALTIGVVGTGAIGSGVCKTASAFNMKILAFDMLQNDELINKYNVKYTDKDTLLSQSDIITLHTPLTEDTKEFITKRELALMKPSAILINTSRGGLIKTEDLYHAITNKTIAGAGLDVIECEQIGFATGDIDEKIKDENKDCIAKVILIRRLAQYDNVIITPHVAYSTQDSINKILKITFEALDDCLHGGHTNQVN